MGVTTRRGLLGRISERDALDRLLENVRGGQSGVLVIRGEAGIGKTALLRYAAERASDFRVAQIAGVEAEMGLPFAGVHQLCTPMLDHLDALPEPQRKALRVALGLSPGNAPDRFLVALAVLSLLSAVAEERPLACLAEDAQWLDEASGQVLGFVARRLLAESVAIVFTVRDPDEGRVFHGLPELKLAGLGREDARALLDGATPGKLDERVRDRILAETRGNPLALLELPRAMSPAELAGGFSTPAAGELPAHIEALYRQRLDALHKGTRRLMLLAAADPVGDAAVLWRAAGNLGIDTSALAPAEEADLLEIGESVRFRHPLIRSAVYRAATPQRRREVHLALAQATDAAVDPDRRAWHLGAAAPGPDEEVALELERSAVRARARGGLAAAAPLLERAVELTQDPGRRVQRALAAAQVSLHAGASEAAARVLATAEAGAPDELERARLEVLRGQIASASSRGGGAPGQLLKAAERVGSLDVGLARETYLDAWGAGLFAGALASGGDLRDVARAARSAPRPVDAPRASDLLLDGLAALVTDGRAAANSTLRAAVSAFLREEIPLETGLRWGVLASSAAVALWDYDSWDAVISRQTELARDAGAPAPLSIALNGEALIVTWRGDFAAADLVAAEADAVTEATATCIAPYGALLVAALRGRESDAVALIDATLKNATAGGEGLAVQYAHWARAVLYNGLGRYQDALVAAQRASDEMPELFLSAWALAELVVAGSRTRNERVAADALERLAESTNGVDADWGLGILARSRALLSEGDAAESLYREAISRLGRARLRPDLARAHLAYGEWLRRDGRRADAREELRAAHRMFNEIGMEAFAERARGELLATGDTARKRRVDTRDELTPQELQIARLAADGLSNPDIGRTLFLSPRTVEWHLHKVFGKLGIRSRRELHGGSSIDTRRHAL